MSIDNSYLRNEAYCQLMKQLTNVPSMSCRSIGWKLMGLFVQFVAPQGFDMECVIETFLTKYEANKYIEDFHKLVFNDKKSDTLNLNGRDVMVMMRAIIEPDVFAWEKIAMRNHQVERLNNARTCGF